MVGVIGNHAAGYPHLFHELGNLMLLLTPSVAAVWIVLVMTYGKECQYACPSVWICTIWLHLNMCPLLLQNEEVAALKEALREEAALSSRAHHNCEVNEREARRFHGLWQRQRRVTAAFLRRLERRGIVEMSSASSSVSDPATEASPTGSGEASPDHLAKQLDTVFAQLELNVNHMEVSVAALEA